MALPPDQQRLLTGLRRGREGVSCERSIRALSFLFHGWSWYPGSRKSFFGKPDNGVMPIIELEKLALFWFRVWSRLWTAHGLRERRKNPLEVASQSETKVQFPPPFTAELAKHGKRLQRFMGTGPPTTLAGILHGLQDLGIRYFEVKPFVEHGIPQPDHYKTEVTRTLPLERRDQLLAGFNEFERSILNEMDNAIRQLGVLEIRALGTHHELVETLRDIAFEFDYITPSRVETVITAIKGGLPFFDVAQDLLEYAEEAHKKSSRERKNDYLEAYVQCTNTIKDPIVLKTFKDTQTEARVIWDAPEMKTVAERAERAFGILSCVTSVGYFFESASERTVQRSNRAREMNHRWQDGCQMLKHNKIELNTPNFASIFEANKNQVRSTWADKLCALLQNVSNN